MDGCFGQLSTMPLKFYLLLLPGLIARYHLSNNRFLSGIIDFQNEGLSGY